MSPIILVIDDNPKVKESLELVFPEYQFIGALSGEQGLKYLRKSHEVDLVILDYKMSGLDGITVLKEIRKLEPEIGILFMTSFGSKEVVVEALRGDADDFIDKPYSVQEMKNKLESFFEKNADKEKNMSGNSMQRIQRFVERNYAKSPTLEEAAEKASLSPKYLSRKFKQETQQNFSDYKIELKMDLAKKLLHETSLGVAQIAYKVGYENSESFVKMFKKILGLTPTEYRQKQNAG